MRVLWITYEPIGKAAQILSGSTTQSGTWIDATADLLLNGNDEINLAVATISNQSQKVVDPESAIVYYGVSGVKRYRGKRDGKSAKQIWAAVLEDFKPDIIQIWGTEFSNGLDVVEVTNGIPVVVFIQGVMRAIDKYKYGGLPLSVVSHHINILDRIKCIKLVMNQRDIHKQVAYEEQLVCMVRNVILDNDWCESQFRSFCSDLKPYRLTLAVNKSFLKDQWNIHTARKNTIFCIAGRTPYKGLHQAIQAIAIVKQQIPDIKLIIPGDMTPQGSALLTRSPYLVYLEKLIEKEGLKDNIDFCGRLNSEQMVQQMLVANVFVMPSCIENHSSTLREAMYLGMPCISSLVGSVYELMVHNQNGLVYRYDEYEDLAFHIIRVLSEPELAVKIGKNAYDSIRKMYSQTQSRDNLYLVYKSIVENVTVENH